MEETRGRTGGAAVSKKPSAAGKSAFDDVFGGPPRFSVPFAARLDDYSEIFGGLGSSCSIPFLDLPPAVDGYDDAPVAARRSGFDYAEVFGGLDFGEFTVSYEELLAEQEKDETGSSSNVRVPEEAILSEQAKEVHEFHSEHSNGRHMACPENNQLTSNSNHSGAGSKQFNLSFNKTNLGSDEGVICETTHVTQLNAVPQFSFIVDEIPTLQVKGSHDNCSTVRGGVNDGKLQNEFIHTSSSDGSRISEDDFGASKKQTNSGCPVSENDNANVWHNSRLSSSHLVSSGDISSFDITYVSISDINLRTRPSQGPPPSRPPPKLFDKQRHPIPKTIASTKVNTNEVSSLKPTEDHEKHFSWVASKSQVHQESAKESSTGFLDVQVDVSSAAAASAAAMKEAMELAQARLKSAKESMERNRDYFLNRRKVGDQEDLRRKEIKVDQTSAQKESFSEVLSPKILSEDDRQFNGIASKEKNKVKSATKPNSESLTTERPVLQVKEVSEMMVGNVLKSSKLVSRSEEESLKWKTNQEYYELINNQKKDIRMDDVIEQEAKSSVKIGKDSENEKKEAALPSEFESDRKLNDNNEKIEEEYVANVKEYHVAVEEKIKEIPSMAPEASVQDENVSELKKAHDVYGEQNERPEGAQKVHEEVTVACATGKAPLPGISDEKLGPFDSYEFQDIHFSKEENRDTETTTGVCKAEDFSHKLEEIHRSKEKNEKSDNAKEDLKIEDDVKKFSMDDVTCEPCENGEISVTDLLDEKESKFPHSSCMPEGGEDAKAASQIRVSENILREEQVECGHEENGDESEGTGVVDEEEKREKLNMKEELGKLQENEVRVEADQETDQLVDDLNKLRSAEGLMQHTEEEKPMKTTKAACAEDCNGNSAKEAEIELKKSEKKEEATQSVSRMGNSEEQRINESDLEVREAHVQLDSLDKTTSLNAPLEIGQRPLDKHLAALQTTLSDGKGSSLNSTQDVREDYSVASEEANSSTKKMEEKQSERRAEREREQAEELARKLEEEREREREREKDRIAVEKATREAHERAYTEARERAERIAVERVTAEARQRAFKEAREKAERASAEALEKSIAEKSLREARLRAERVAVERATAEARERAVERALAEKAAADAKERAERSTATSKDRMRKENVTDHLVKAGNKDGSHVQFLNTGSFSSSQGYSDSYKQREGESALRCKARLERHQRTAERAAKALAEKNMRDILAQREQAERNRLAEFLDADVKRWSTGKEGNLRALLSTLQYILGPDSGWQPIPLTDVITAAAVKKAYRKATLCVHPDKLQQRGASIQQKYICEKVFDLLKEAWNKFNSEER